MYSAEDFIKIPSENWVREDSDQGRFGHFFTDRGEQHLNLVVMENLQHQNFQGQSDWVILLRKISAS